MAYTTNQLIANAYYLSGIVSKDFETVSGPQFQEGLDTLNFILAEKTVDTGMIPYYQQYDFTAIPNQEAYFIPNLIDIETFTFFINDVRYSTRKNSRHTYFGSPRADNIQSLPFNWHLERTYGGATLYMYFKPDVSYPLQIWGLFRLNGVAQGQDLSLTLDLFYIEYLMYQLAQRLCDLYSYVVPPNIMQRLEKIEKNIEKRSGEMDLAQRTISVLDKSYTGLNYGMVNLGKGWSIN